MAAMIPRYGEWDRRYRDRGLIVVGVHTPETESERDVRGISDYVRRHRIAWKVVLDPYFEAWRRYRVDAWPTVFLIDRKGLVRWAFVGDHEADRIETALRGMLGD